ncbi:MAG: chorismate-binding protein, partial [Egibacteraceae bacterium]
MSVQARAITARTVEVADPGDLVTRLPDTGGFAWVREGQGLIAWGEVARVDVGTGQGRFARASAVLSRILAGVRVEDEVGLAGTGPVAFGSFTFDPARQGSVLVVPRVVLGRRDGRAWLTVLGGDSAALGPVQALAATGRIRYAGTSLSELRWMEAVDNAVRAIRRGDLKKVVLARDVQVWCEQALDPRVLVHRLTERFPQCFAFACAGLVGATPELLVRRLGDR